jgi:hypothetical protein
MVADGQTRDTLIAQRDQAVAGFSNRIARPRRLSIRLLLRLIRLAEKGDVPWRIGVLKTFEP